MIHRLPLTRVVSALRATKKIADLILSEMSGLPATARLSALRGTPTDITATVKPSTSAGTLMDWRE